MRLFGKRGGYILMECTLAACIIGIAAAAAVPLYQTYEENRLLDGAAAQVVSVIYEAEAAVRNGDSSVPNAGEKVTVIFKLKNDRVYYYCTRGSNAVRPFGYLPEGVTIASSPLEILFYKNRFPIDSATKTFQIKLRSEKNKKKGRDVIVALYTGRVHVEEAQI